MQKMSYGHVTKISRDEVLLSEPNTGINPFPNNNIPNRSKLKELADDNFKFDKHGRKSSKRIENTVRKGEIAHYEQFLLFPRCFQKTSTADT